MGLFRTAFIIAFVVVGTISPFRPEVRLLVWLLLMVATVFTVALFLTFGAGRAIPYQRHLALLIDLSVVSAAILVTGPEEGQALFQVYYLIVLIGAIWFQLVGAFLTATLAIALFMVVQYLSIPDMSFSEVVLSVFDRGAVFLLLIAVISGYLVRALDRQHQATAGFVQELQLARTVQDTILPRSLPDLPGWQLALRFEPARWVGGDLYEVARLPDGQYLICLGDMPGKSAYGLVHLSLIYSHVRGAAFAGLQPAAIANRVNRAVYEVLQPYSYAPLFIGMINIETGVINFVSCGHPPPLLLHTDGSWELLSSSSIVIGGWHETDYQQQQQAIAPGEILISYTDGISGVRDRAGNEFGEERIAQTARTAQQEGGSLEDICQEIVSESQRFAAEPHLDDATLILLQRGG